MLEHGGNLDLALQRFGGRLDDWIDLSTGINRQPYPLPPLSPRHWGALPSRSEIGSLHEAARQAYGARAPIVALAGGNPVAAAVVATRPGADTRARL
jgi:cobalamin biosynthetic protein CobC